MFGFIASTSSTMSNPEIADGSILTGVAYLKPDPVPATVTSIEYLVDGVSKNTQTASPWGYAGASGLDTATLSNGAHVVTAKVTEAGGANYILRSRALANATAWSVFKAAVSGSPILSWDGSYTAYKITSGTDPLATTHSIGIQTPIDTTAGQQWTLKIRGKGAELVWVMMRVRDHAAQGVNYARRFFNFTPGAGAVGATGGGAGRVTLCAEGAGVGVFTGCRHAVRRKQNSKIVFLIRRFPVLLVPVSSEVFPLSVYQTRFHTILLFEGLT
jgi:hypothetical protein